MITKFIETTKDVIKNIPVEVNDRVYTIEDYTYYFREYKVIEIDKNCYVLQNCATNEFEFVDTDHEDCETFYCRD